MFSFLTSHSDVQGGQADNVSHDNWLDAWTDTFNLLLLKYVYFSISKMHSEVFTDFLLINISFCRKLLIQSNANTHGNWRNSHSGFSSQLNFWKENSNCILLSIIDFGQSSTKSTSLCHVVIIRMITVLY